MLFFTPVGFSLVVLLVVSQNERVMAAVSAWNEPIRLLAHRARDMALAWRDPQDVLADRSPGTRDPDALYSIKPDYLARLFGAPEVPHERVLSVVRDRPNLGPNTFYPEELALAPPLDGPLALGNPGLASPLTPASFPVGRTLPPLGGTSPGGGGGGGGAPPAILSPPEVPGVPPGGPPGGPPEEPVVPPAVPEPSTWLMNIVGFLAIAAVLRYRRQVVRTQFHRNR